MLQSILGCIRLFQLCFSSGTCPGVRGRLRNPVCCIFLPLCAISQGFSVPYQFLFWEWVELRAVLRTEKRERVPAWIPFSNSLQWLFSASATLYVLDYSFCCNWWNFILCNSRVIILLKIYKPAFLLIKYPCSTRDLGPRVILSFSLPLANSLDRRNLPSSRCCPDFQDLFKRTPCASVSGTSPVLGLYWFSL